MEIIIKSEVEWKYAPLTNMKKLSAVEAAGKSFV